MKVAVFFGGKSCEHEVSVLTGLLATKLLNTKVDCIPIYLSLENELYDGTGKTVNDLKNLSCKGMKRVELVKGGLKIGFHTVKVDVALNCCHGGFCEGGGLSALLEWFQIPSCSPSMTESALFQDKYLSKLAVHSLGVRTVEGLRLTEETYLKRRGTSAKLVEEKLGYPVVVKPNRLGSSVGIGVANDREELEACLKEAFAYDDSALIEKYLEEKRDVNCAVYETNRLVVSDCEEVLSSKDILSFHDKYESARRTSLLEGELADEIKRMSARIYQRMALRGVVRLDFLVSENKAYFNELNVVPGSLAYYLFSPSLGQARELLLSLINKTNDVHKKISTSGLLKQGNFFVKNSCKIR